MRYCCTAHLPLIPLFLCLIKALPIYQPPQNSYPVYNQEENLGVNIFLTEGDILVDRTQISQFFANPKRRSIELQFYKTWYNRSVPYMFDSDFSSEGQKQVEAAMFDIQNSSCIRFKKRTIERDYIRFVMPNTGCYSPVGRVGGRQDIWLERGCFIHGTIQHEILHALGLWHEQSRQDRDEYIKVMWDNIPKEHWKNFEARKPAESHELFLTMPYDYGSVMHYSNNTFAIDRRKPTLVPKQDLPRGVVMGQRVGLSPGDVDKLNALYRCDISNCSEPGTLTNGRILGTDFSVGAEIHYYCDTGYILIGAAARVCRDIGDWSGQNPACLPSDITNSLHYCNFDDYSSRLCGWSQTSDDDLNWTPQTGPTMSPGTGPQWDHTLGTLSGGYVYVEASYHRPYLKARLVSPTFYSASQRTCLVFFTYMYGQSMGNLTVYLTPTSTSPSATPTVSGNRAVADSEILMSLSGDQGQIWRQVFLELDSGGRPFTITIEGIIGDGLKSDIAVDDIIIGDCSAFKPIATSGGLPETLECNFDTNLCDFWQDKRDDMEWDFNIGKTPTFETGPDCDPKDCQNGQYLYIEASRPRVMGNRARLKTPVIGGEGRRCLSFYYHMYGEHIGSLTIKRISALSGREQILWAASGNQGNSWHLQHVDVVALEAYEIAFDGTVGPSYKGDIALDSISVTVGRCTDSLQFDCSFESDLCGWVNAPVPGDTLDWLRHTGETDSPGTGPSSDRNSIDGYYLYVESSRTTIGDSARLVSPIVAGSPTGHCLLFWYHMYGRSSGNLTVSCQTDVGREEVLWSKTGDQGNVWRSRHVNITNTGGHNFNIIFEANMVGFTGDVAIDDISILNSLCGS